MACVGDVQTGVGGVVVGEMMQLVAWCAFNPDHVDAATTILILPSCDRRKHFTHQEFRSLTSPSRLSVRAGCFLSPRSLRSMI